MIFSGRHRQTVNRARLNCLFQSILAISISKNGQNDLFFQTLIPNGFLQYNIIQLQ